MAFLSVFTLHNPAAQAGADFMSLCTSIVLAFLLTLQLCLDQCSDFVFDLFFG